MRTWVLLLVMLAGCRGEPKRKPKGEDSGSAAPAAPRDALAAMTAGEAERLFLGVPTARAAKEIVDRLAAPPTSPVHASDHAARDIARTLGRLGWKIGVADYQAPARRVRNILGFLPGASDDAIILGNHFDAPDRHTGTAVLIEIARGLTALTRAGWKPRRTIILGFWDAEGDVAGANEWIEEQRAMLHAKALAYLEVDAVGPSAIAVESSPALREHVRSCAGDVADPSTGKPAPPQIEDLGLGAGRSGSFHHLGVASLHWKSAAGAGAGDRDAAIERFAKVIGLCTLRLATAEHVPLRYSETAAWLTAAVARFEATLAGRNVKLDRARLDAALEALRAAALHAESMPVRGGGDPATCNHALAVAERGFVTGEGPAAHHLASGPGRAPDAAVALPELVAARDQQALTRATARLVEAIERVASTLGACR